MSNVNPASLRQVDLQRTFTFRNSKQTYTGIPVIAANMDTTGTFEMARVLSKVSRYSNGTALTLFKLAGHCSCMLRKTSISQGILQTTEAAVSLIWLTFLLQHTLFTAIHKHYSVEDWKKFAVTHPECLEVRSASGWRRRLRGLAARLRW